MESTVDMFDPDPAPAIARKSDPVTSKIAAIVYTNTNRPTDKDLMLSLIRELPGKTPGEYGEILKSRGVKALKAHQITSKRISDIKERLVPCIKRKCSITGHLAQTYYVKSDFL